jgi:two-component system, chemotaxis family, CheB/CheR fusion protein
VDRAHSDLRNLFDSTQIATIFLDKHLFIRSFTPAVTSLFNLISTDPGRP